MGKTAARKKLIGIYGMAACAEEFSQYGAARTQALRSTGSTSAHKETCKNL